MHEVNFDLIGWWWGFIVRKEEKAKGETFVGYIELLSLSSASQPTPSWFASSSELDLCSSSDAIAWCMTDDAGVSDFASFSSRILNYASC